MNKNNTSIPNFSQPDHSKSKNKDCDGRSEFTRYKLQRQYQPKIILRKHKLPKTTQQQRQVQLRIQRQKEQEMVVVNALEYFKKGELINIDWKTKTNFRKSQIKVKLPRLKTQTLELRYTDPPNSRSNRSHTFQDRHSKSLKNKDIQQKRTKLKQLLYPKTTSKHPRKFNSLNQDQQHIYDNRNSIFSQSKSAQMLNEITSISQIDDQEQNINSCLNQCRMVSGKNGNLNFAFFRSQTEQMKNLHLLPEPFLQNSERDNHLNHKINTISSNFKDSSSHIEKNSNNRNQTSFDRQESVQKGLITTQSNKSQRKNHENYDILNDPQIYLLISKSRDRIISWKESCILDSMNQIDRLKFQQQNASKSPANHQRQEKQRALSLQNIKMEKNLEKNKMIEKIVDNKRIKSEKLKKKLNTQVLTETQQFLRQSSMTNSANHSQIYSYLGIKSPQSPQQKFKKLFKPKQSVIRRKKKSSLIEVQEKLLKRVKLSFLKQDLTKKFEQIRTEQSNSALHP